jgi:hypothetical protein
MEVDSTALKPTPDGKMSMDTPDTDELKMGTAVVSTEQSVITELDPPPNDSTSPIHGGQDCEDLSRLRELTGNPTANTPFVPKDYQTKEPLKKGPDGKWRNSKGEERDSLHGGPISAGGGAMHRGLTLGKPTRESADLTAMLRIAGLR